MVKLSVIIVNYNVKYFLEQCLASVYKAIPNITAEIIVVDNDSVDGSCEMVREKFPEVILIANTTNTGFSVANNQGMRIAKGEYVLLLNPDTLVQEDTFTTSVKFMDDHTDAGALGIKMLDGKGQFLPESKRALPTPWVSFFKIFGLSSLFPKSKTFARYHLGYLSPEKNHEVDILAGAYMLMRKEALDKVGLLDEEFFMYGEDVDLSYRIQKGGYKNYYFAESRIIHYKGESTKKGSLNYVRMFYKAMMLFAQKHFSSQQAKLYSRFIELAIYLKASVSVVGRVMKKLLLPAMDALLLISGMYAIKEFWATRIKNAAEYYPEEYMLLIVPLYILLWILGTYFNGGYDKPIRLIRVVRGIAISTLVIAGVYAFLPEEYRFSRAMILLGSVWAIFSLVGLRWLLSRTLDKQLIDSGNTLNSRMVIVGDQDEGRRALSLIDRSGWGFRFIGFVTPSKEEGEDVLGSLADIELLKQTYHFEEVLFCNKIVSVDDSIATIQQLGPQLNYKFMSEVGDSIVGSNSKNSAGDLYAIDLDMAIASPMNRRNKRVIDIAVSLLLTLLLPISILLVKNKTSFIRNLFSVFIGKKTWVGYSDVSEFSSKYRTPSLKKGVLYPALLHDRELDDSTMKRLDLFYARDYSPYADLRLITKRISLLGN